MRPNSLSFLLGGALGVLFATSACGALPFLATATPLPTETPVPSATALPSETPVPTQTLPPPSETLPPATVTPLPSETATATLEPQARLMTGGDVMLGRTVGVAIVRQGTDKPFAGVQSTLSQADLLLFNLECPIGVRGQPVGKAYNFLCPMESADTLALAGVDVISWSNNHVLDYGVLALEDGWNALTQRGIQIVGAGWNSTQARTPAILERNGLKFAVLGYVDVPKEDYGFNTAEWIAGENKPGVAWAFPEDIAADVAAIRPQVDHVIVMFQNGYEGRNYPVQAQIDQAHAAIDAGASLVIGSHPHLLQPYEVYNNGLILYSMGNFVFDGFLGDENKSAIADITFGANGIKEFHFIPVVLELGFPRLATDAEAPAILKLIPPLE